MSDSIQNLQKWLDGFLNFEKLPQKDMFWLDSMEFLCEEFHHPEIFAECFHVAGSKGKGSVSAMIASILDSTGTKVGLYTSPHILDFFERISSAHSPLGKEVYEAAADYLMEKFPEVEGRMPKNRPLTWFEAATIYAMLCFREARVDFSVYEVGMGGRLDATNVITPMVSVITPIELEHCEFLGDTLEKIAREKAGIIKNNVPVVSASQSDSVRDVLKSAAKEKNSKIVFADDVLKTLEYRYESGLMRLEFDSKLFKRPIRTMTRFFGKVQAENAALAALAAKIALPRISERFIEVGLAASYLPGRFEILDAQRSFGVKDIVLDGAHTANSVGRTLETFDEVFGKTGGATLLFACAADKNCEEIAPLFRGRFSDIFLTRPGSEKASDIERTKRAFANSGLEASAGEDFKAVILDALRTAARKKTPLLVTGSFYLLSEVKKILG